MSTEGALRWCPSGRDRCERRPRNLLARETLEDYALHFTTRTFRKWSEWRVANTAFGAAPFLILEAVGATLLVQHGFVNAALAILATGLFIFLADLPACRSASTRRATVSTWTC